MPKEIQKLNLYGSNFRVESQEKILGRVVCETEVEIKTIHGLHMLAAIQFIDIASQFDCDITVNYGKRSADGKSIMQMSMLAVTQGSKLKIRAVGPDAQEAIDSLRELVEEKMLDEATANGQK